MGRTRLDVGRMREGMRGPGADPRTWVTFGRVDDDDDAIRWEVPHGWIVDVTFSGGQLEGEGPIACRVLRLFAADGATRQEPVFRGAEVAVVLSEGDPNASPLIIGMVHNGGGSETPEEVNGTTIDEDYSLATHILVTPHALDYQIDGDVRIKTTGTARLLGPLVELAEQDAGQSFVRGDDQKDALNAFLDALSTWAVLVKAGIVAAGGTLENAALDAAINVAKQQFASALSSKVKGE